MELLEWNWCSCTTLGKTQTQWLREVSIAGTQEWAGVPGNPGLCQPLGGLQHCWKRSCSVLHCISVSQGRQTQTERNVLFSEHQQAQIKPRALAHKTGMLLTDKVCSKPPPVLPMSIFSWHMDFQHPVLCERTAISLQAPINSDGLTDGKCVMSPLNFPCTCPNNTTMERSLPSSSGGFWRS